MANHLVAILQQWHQQKEEFDWVLATVVGTEGSSYRKPGAMMLINSLGQYFGIVSGGCLESDIMRQARKCLLDGKQRTVVYDMLDEDDFAWKLGIGCGGKVEVLLQPVSADNDYLALEELLLQLQAERAVYYVQSLSNGIPENSCMQGTPDEFSGNGRYQISGQHHFISYHLPRFKFVIFGAGVDAQPLAKLADVMGWQVILVDERLGYGKPQYFPKRCEIVREPYKEIDADALLEHAQAAVLMNHNVTLDALSLALCHQVNMPYIGILGPSHRTEKVLQKAGLTPNDFRSHVANPVGLDLGGELPESIALAIVSEIHAFLHKTTAKSLSTFNYFSSCQQITA